ncbi:glycosyltransferase family 2 protein [Aurantimonas sp. HBX-1]|uniref:glycosyltransferase family 2 protein n=1 Tax=Aurantimonas sp. HBX-1 TaxID=2906072 RepID=UPI001F2F2DE4|nr:glycosyltransferase [Aurantimonas sp. HBX-1]UIJ71333.1 glycosyltransferase [Aurantimonas sp. HBX-1]
MNEAVSIERVSPGLSGEGFDVVVTLPTFRRPEHLLRTLASLQAQETSHRFAVIVIENDDEGGEGRRAADPLFAGGALAGLVITAHARGNCSAYNAGWATALERFPSMRYLAVIDDDELAGPDWLERLVATAECLPADIVGGPQIPVFEKQAGRGVLRHPVFVPHYAVTGPVPILYSSGNVLIRRAVLETMGAPFLDTAFNFIGGGDSDFYSRCRERGFSFGWCAEAPVHETTPPRRMEFSWLNARGMRNGALSSIIERRRQGGRRGSVRRLAKSAALLAASPFRSAALAARTGSAVAGLYPMQVAIGRLLAEFGIVNEQYRRPDQN